MKVKVTADVLAIFIAELLGTGILVFLGCMGCITWSGKPNHLQIIFNFGLTVMIAINIFGMVSGGHLNPAVSAAAWIYKKISLPMFGVYFVAQMLGGFMGYGLLKVLTPGYLIKAEETATALCVTKVHRDVTIIQGLVIEFLATMVLVMLCCAVWDPRNNKYHDSVALRFGLAVSALACAAGPYTGASMNPARSFGPALWNMDFDQHWIYWFGPMAAAFITAFTFRVVFFRKPIDEDERMVRLEEIALNSNNKS